MDPEKPDLSQTGLSIKKHWKAFVEAWIQPELEVNRRLFETSSGNTEAYAIEGLPLQRSIDEVNKFIGQLCFYEWPFEWNETEQAGHGENVQEALPPGRKAFVHSQRNFSEVAGGNAGQDSHRSVKSTGGKPTLQAQRSESSAVHEQLKLGHDRLAAGQPDANFSHHAIVAPTDQPVPPAKAGRKFDFLSSEAPHKTAEATRKDALTWKEEERQDGYTGLTNEQNTGYPTAGSTPADSSSGIDNQGVEQEKVREKTRETLNSQNAVKSRISPFEETEDELLLSAENTRFSPVKSLQSLGAWLQEHPIEEHSGQEMFIGKGQGKGILSPLQGPPGPFRQEPAKSVFLENDPEPLNSPDYPGQPEILPVPQAIEKPVRDIFDDPFNFQGDQSNKPDTEDLIREITERLNREFKRFYGV